MICIQQPTLSPPGPGAPQLVQPQPLRATAPRLPHYHHEHHQSSSSCSVPSASASSTLALTSTAAGALGMGMPPLQPPFSLQQSSLPSSSSFSSQQQQQQHLWSSMASTSTSSSLQSTAPPAPRSSRAERSLLSVLERERRGRANSSSTAPNAPAPAASSSPLVGPAPYPPPCSTPPPPTVALSPASSRSPSRPSSRGPSRSTSPVPSTRDAFGFGNRTVDLASLVERSIALQSSSPANTPPSSPPRPARRPLFSTSPSLAASTTIPETAESDTEGGNTSSSSVTATIRAHRKRAATITSLCTQGAPAVRAGAGPLAPGNSNSNSLAAPTRPSVGPRTRSSPTPSTTSTMPPMAAPVPRRAAVANIAAASLLPIPHSGLTHLSPSSRNQVPAYTPSNTLAVRGTQRTIPGVQGILLNYNHPEPRGSTITPPYSYPGANATGASIPAPNLYTPVAHAHNLRPAISIASVASAASAQSAGSMQSNHSDPRGVPITPSSTPPMSSPLNPRPPSRRGTPKRNAPRPISGPFLAPAMGPTESDIPFDFDRAARTLRNAPGRVCFDDVALFPPSDDADDEDEEDSARKRPRMGRRWSLW